MNLFFSGIVEAVSVVNDAVALQANNTPVLRSNRTRADGTVIADANGHYANTGNVVAADGRVNPRVDGYANGASYANGTVVESHVNPLTHVAPVPAAHVPERRLAANSAYLATYKTDRRIAHVSGYAANGSFANANGSVASSFNKPVVSSSAVAPAAPIVHANGAITPGPTTNVNWFNRTAGQPANTALVIDPNSGVILHDPSKRRAVTMTVRTHDQKNAQHFHGSITFTCEVEPGVGIPAEGDLVTIEVKG